MKKITWEVQYLSPPPVVKYCKKCATKTEYGCSGLFRVNAQRKTLDIWLIYKCANCDTTWNATIYSRINSQSLSSELLAKFQTNDRALADEYAMDLELLHRNGVTVGLPRYIITGVAIASGAPVELRIISKYPCPIKIATLIREKLSLSQKTFDRMLANGQIKSVAGLDLKKCKLHREAVLMIESESLGLNEKVVNTVE